MTTRLTIAVVVVAMGAAAAGWFANARWGGAPGAGAPFAEGGPCPGGAKPLYWKAPMDPTYVRDAPGKSPMGMDLVPVCPGEGGAAAKATGIRIDPVLVQSMGLRTAPVERRDLARAIRAVGRVAVDERRVSHVHTKIQGWVEKLYVDYEGQEVEKGHPLLEIYSPALVSTQEELLVAARYRDETAASPVSDVRRSGEQLYDATRRRLELWDVPERDIERLLRTGEVRERITLDAPARGVVTQLSVREGMEVAPNENLYTLSDLSRVWVFADLYESELPWVEEGQRATVELSYLPDRRFEGVVRYVYPFLDPKTRTLRVRLDIANPDGLLKPDMFANVRIEAETRPDVIAVPDEAVLRSGRRTLVIVALGDGRFEPRDVTLGLDSGDGWLEVREGLSEGETIVTSGQFLIDSESRLREAAEKLLEPAAAEAEEEAAGPPVHDHTPHVHEGPSDAATGASE